MNPLVVGILILWALPWTLLGCLVGVVGMLTGGSVARRGRVLEFSGGAVAWMLTRLPFVQGGAMAMTLGHVVLGTNLAALDATRRHELVHVRQYERWGPLFIPAYLLASIVLFVRGKDPYRDNPFERQAYDETGV